MSRPFVPSQHEFRKYQLIYDSLYYNIEVPDNWEIAQKELARSKQYHGVIVTLSDDIIFSGASATLINRWFAKDGVIANIHIVEYEKDMTTDEWELVFGGDLDLSVYSVKDNTVITRVNSNSLVKKLQSRYQTEIDFKNISDLDGNEHGLGPLKTVDLLMGSRRITGECLLSIGTKYDSIDAPTQQYATILMTSRKEGFFGDLPRVFAVNKERVSTINPDVQNICFYNQQKIGVDVTLNTNWKGQFLCPSGYGQGSYVKIQVRLYEWIPDPENPDEEILYNYFTENIFQHQFAASEQAELKYLGTDTYYCPPRTTMIVIYDTDFTGFPDVLNPNYSDDPDAPPLPQYIPWYYTTVFCDINFNGPVTGGETTSDSVKAFDMFQRAINMMGGGQLISDHLTASDILLASGYMFRNVPEYPFVYTFEKLFNSFDSFLPLGLQIENNTVIIEEREYFYQNFLTIDFGANVSNVVYKFDKEQAYSEINIGFESSNFTAEAAAKEYNVKSIYVSPINIYKKELSFVSNIQASSNVIETLRRVQYQEDTERSYTRRGDATMFAVDSWLNKTEQNPSGTYEPRPWSLDFTEIPTGIKLAGDQFNYRLSPMNRLKKIAQWINFGYSQFTNRSLTFSSSTGATALATWPLGGEKNKENDSFVISDLNPAWYLATTVSIQIEPQNLYALLREKENGVPKMYGLFKFTHNGYEVTGYLQSYHTETFEMELQIKEMKRVQ